MTQCRGFTKTDTSRNSDCSKWYYILASFWILVVLPVKSQDIEETTYREHLLLSDQLCPNPVTFDRKSKVAASNAYELDLFPPSDKNACILNRQDGSRALVRAISSSVEPWDYSGANKCDGMTHLNLERSSQIQQGSDPKYWCQMDRWKQNLYGGKYFDPQLWLFPKGQLGVYFSTEDWDSTFHLDDMGPISPNRPQFIQFAFNTFSRDEVKGSRCSLVVQQYAINHERHECRSWDVTYQNCGVYDCSQNQGEVLNQMGFSTISTENNSTGSGGVGNETVVDYFEEVHFESRTDLFRKSQQEKLDRFLAIAEVISLVAAVVAAVNVFLFSFLRFPRPDAHGEMHVTA